ncbi:MAG: hypothetical protein Ct9H300mP9_6280 [Candidatus Neomarinimicrobiota bacterium]|nr:MAG: hypothetical protein Ct9H300mP9_6280 [Candidatus Neomarinimicrobiota bacterium]
MCWPTLHGFFRILPLNFGGRGGYEFSPMMVAALGTILNILLDPLFIFELDQFGGIGFGLGVKGAAIATVLSQATVFVIFFLCFI